MALYEPGAIFVVQQGEVVTGTGSIREVLAGFLAMKGTLARTKQTVLPAGDLALLHGEWTLRGTGPDGNAFDLTMHSSEVVRRQPDGTWRYVIDAS
jgi:ketosteroid isomerase-like protein